MTIPCPECGGEGIYRTGITRDPVTGTWEATEHDCVWCDGTGTAIDHNARPSTEGAA